MPGELSATGGDIALDATTGRTTQTARTMYLALLTVAPTDADTPVTMTEIATAGYARQSVAFDAPVDNAGARRIVNSAQITFGPFSADPPSVAYCALVSSVSGTTGDLTMFWTLDVAKDAAINESIQFAAAALSMDVD